LVLTRVPGLVRRVPGLVTRVHGHRRAFGAAAGGRRNRRRDHTGSELNLKRIGTWRSVGGRLSARDCQFDGGRRRLVDFFRAIDVRLGRGLVDRPCAIEISLTHTRDRFRMRDAA
jgi:hypothetical protein